MEERGSKEKVIREIKNYQKTILQDFWEEVQAFKREATPLFENGIDESRYIRTSKAKVDEEIAEVCYEVVDEKMVRKLQEMLNSIKEEDLEAGLKICSEYMRTEDEEDGYVKLFVAYLERFEKIENFPADYDFMITALRFAQM